MSQFKDLSTIFEADENGDEQRARTILDAEGTAKSSPLKRPELIQTCRRSKSDVNLAESHGTVPYLGTFLTDLTMLDQAHYDKTTEGLLNFEKRRREFEVLAKIRLFQSAARAYTVPMDQAFCIWFTFLPSLDEKEW
jgi:ral guanine nucleotide dissociation stimulator-like 1